MKISILFSKLFRVENLSNLNVYIVEEHMLGS